MGIGSLTTLAGFVVMLRCAWAVSQYRDLLKLTQQDFTRLPQHLQLELAIATVLCCIGGYLIAGTMKPLMYSRGVPSMDTGSVRPSFVTVSHRGKALPLPPGLKA